MPTASVIIPTYNASLTLGQTLEALAGQSSAPDFEVIVVDDGSTDDTRSVVTKARLDVRLLEQDNLGPAAARNLGASAAEGEVLAFTDADCVPAPGWLAAGLAALEDADLVQGAVHADPGAVRKPFDRTVWVTREIGLYETASLFVQRELFESLGGFQDVLEARLGKQLAEDTWFGWRARRHGARTAFSSAARVDHAVFRRGPGRYVAERGRLVYFPALARSIPELRDEFFWNRYFLSSRSASFDLALAGVAAAAGAGVIWPLVVATPYVGRLVGDAFAWRLRAPVVAVVDAAADAVSFGALLAGTVRNRSIIL